MSSDGSGAVPLTSGAESADTAPSWSADGSQVAFARGPANATGDTDIYAVRREGTALRRLTDSPGADTEPVWSPDGTSIAFASARGGAMDIYVMNADGSDQRRLTTNAAADSSPSWSPDGSEIAFASQRAIPGLYTVAADGGAERYLNTDGGSPDWSPDGSQLVFARGDGIYVTGRDGLGSRRVVASASGTGASNPTWSPDGTRIMYVLFTPASSGALVSVRPDGGDPQSYTPTGRGLRDDAPSWGTRLADPVSRLAGSNRFQTASAISQARFAGGSAQAAVVARGDAFPDALSAAPLATAKGGPLLLTASDRLTAEARAELQRALPQGRVVYIVGGVAAVSDDVAAEVQSMGYVVQRIAGADRFDTAVAVADQGLGGPETVLLATGRNFPDALGAGAAAGINGAAVLLTDDDRLPPSVVSYLARHPNAKRYAVGGPAAAADRGAIPIVGTDRYETSVRLAQMLVPRPRAVGIASGENFPDALTGAPASAARRAPLLLVQRSAVPTAVLDHIRTNSPGIANAELFGGEAAVEAAVVTTLQDSIA